MKIDEMIHVFRNELLREYGKDGLTKIALDPDLFQRVCEEFYTRQNCDGHTANPFLLRDRGEFFIEGVQLVARDPKREF